MNKTQIRLCLNCLSIMVCLLLSLTTGFAQHSKQQKQLAHTSQPVSIANSLSLTQSRAGIHLINGKKNITISNKATDTHAVLLQDEVYFIRQQKNSDAPTTLMAYSVAENKLTDKLAEITAGSIYDKKSEIFKLLSDTKNQRLYICSRIKTSRGNYEVMTWCFDKNTKIFKSYQDGEMSGIDAEGNQTFLFTNSDAKGTYTVGRVLNVSGTIIKEIPRTYKSVNAIK